MYINCTVVIYIFILFNKNQKQNLLRLDTRFYYCLNELIKKRFLDIGIIFYPRPLFFPSGECQIKLHLSNVNYIFSNYVQQGTIINVML